MTNWHGIGLAAFSLTLLPAGLALVAGRVPARLRPRLVPMRPRGSALLALYAVAPLNTIPRLTGASEAVTLACTVAGGVLAVTGCVLVGVFAQRAKAAAP